MLAKLGLRKQKGSSNDALSDANGRQRGGQRRERREGDAGRRSEKDDSHYSDGYDDDDRADSADGEYDDRININGASSSATFDVDDVEALRRERYGRRSHPAESGVAKSARESFLARKACGDDLHAPTSHATAFNAHMAPDNDLQLDFAYGYRGHDALNNGIYNADGRIVYATAACGIVYDGDEHTQEFFTFHGDDILCLAVHPDLDIVATGQAGRDPVVCVWSTRTREVLAELRGFHQRAVTSLSFDATGKFLATIGLDDEHSIAVYDWENKKVLANSKGDTKRIFDCAYNPHDGRIVTVGERHIKFWIVENGYLVGKNGVYGRLGKPSTLLSVAFGEDGSTFTGTQHGTVYQWADGGEECIQKFDFVHQGPVHDIFVTEDYVITGGGDGKINFCTQYMEKVFTISMSQVAESIIDEHGKPVCYYDGRAPCVRSLHLSGVQLLVGTATGELYEFDLSTEDAWKRNRRIITQGHANAVNSATLSYSAELWGLDCHPSKAKFITAGDDKTVRAYDMYLRRQVSARSVASRARSCSYSPDGKYIAVGFYGGGFLVYEEKTGAEVAAKKHRRSIISDVKFSPDGRWLAVASHDFFIDVYDTTCDFKRAGVCKGHSAPVTHLDWSEDSKYLQSNSQDFELFFWEMPTCELIEFSAALKDVQWATWTCVAGWPVTGVWPKHSDGTDVLSCARSRDGRVVATTNEDGIVRLFRYPNDVGRGDHKTYVGHSFHVTKCCFSFNDEFLITIGGEDRTTLQWRHYEPDEGDEEMTSDVEEEVFTSVENYTESSAAIVATPMVFIGHVRGVPQYVPASVLDATPSRDIPSHSGLDPGSRLAFLPCASSVFAPDNYERDADILNPPMESVTLEATYGFRAYDSRNNLFYTALGDVVYPTASLNVVYNRQTHTQNFMATNPAAEHIQGHTDDITCLTRHPNGMIFASGEVGRNPKLIVWSANMLAKPVTIIRGYFKTAIVSATFSRDGSKLCAVDCDIDHKIGLYDWKTGELISRCSGSPEKIVSIEWSPFQDYIVTAGVKHCVFWATNPLKGRKAVFSKHGTIQTALCIGFPAADTTIVGTQDGSLYLFRGYQLGTNARRVHTVTQSIVATRDTLISAGSEGIVKFWTADLSMLIRSVTIEHPYVPKACIKSMHLLGKMLLLGARSGEVYEMNTTSYSYNLLFQGHAYGTIWGLDVHPSDHQICTVGDDSTIRIWDVPSRRLFVSRALGAQARSVAYHPDGTHISVGLSGGGIVILSSDSLDTVHLRKDREQPIGVLKYSPNGQYLAVGSDEHSIDIYDISKQYSRIGVSKGHSAKVTHIDWSSDSALLQSSTSNREIMFWEMPNGAQVKFPHDLRNVDWHTWTSVVGWPVQGIIPQTSTGEDITCCDRTHTRTAVASGDARGVLRLYQYPCHRGAVPRCFGAHSGPITQCKFLFDDSYLITVGADMTICQWRVVIGASSVPQLGAPVDAFGALAVRPAHPSPSIPLS